MAGAPDDPLGLFSLALSLTVYALLLLLLITQTDGPSAAATKPRAQAPPTDAASLTRSLATPEEQLVIEAASRLLPDVCASVHDHVARRRTPVQDRLLQLQLLRHLRAYGPATTAEALASAYRKAWDRRHGARSAASVAHRPMLPDGTWHSTTDLLHGEWARQFVQIGLRCGRGPGKGHFHAAAKRTGHACDGRATAA